MKNEEIVLINLFEKWSKKKIISITPLPGSGSYRKYFRIKSRSEGAIGVYNEDRKENTAFLTFTRHFFKEGLPVPEIYAENLADNAYLLSDLGDLTLYGFLSSQRQNSEDFPQEIIVIYKKVLSWLPRFQVMASRTLDYSVCYPRAVFDRQSMYWDLNYFKYYFLKLAKIPFDEQKLEDDFTALTDFLLSAGTDHFMYRDFQSRNIMLVDHQPCFIDYQGGRKGPLQYDIASLLYDAKASIPRHIREELLEEYLEQLNRYISVDRKVFLKFYDGFVLIRILQALGAYGFRGYYENKPHFLQSIPFALKNLEFLLNGQKIPLPLPMLQEVLYNVFDNPSFQSYVHPANNLTVKIFSFSYKKPLPQDESGNGGGFVFDCRALPNPGKYEEFKDLTGKDHLVVNFLKNDPAVDEYLNHVFGIVDQSVKKYMERNFTSLMISFGCTGGQHRSVYCSEELGKHLLQTFPVKIIIRHSELNQ